MCWNSDSTYKENIPVKKELDTSQFDESIEDIKLEPLDNLDENKLTKRSTKVEVEKVDVDEVDYETDEQDDDDEGEYNQSDDEEEGSESDNESESAFYTSQSIKNEETETQQNKL